MRGGEGWGWAYHLRAVRAGEDARQVQHHHALQRAVDRRGLVPLALRQPPEGRLAGRQGIAEGLVTREAVGRGRQAELRLERCGLLPQRAQPRELLCFGVLRSHRDTATAWPPTVRAAHLAPCFCIEENFKNDDEIDFIYTTNNA